MRRGRSAVDAARGGSRCGRYCWWWLCALAFLLLSAPYLYFISTRGSFPKPASIASLDADVIDISGVGLASADVKQVREAPSGEGAAEAGEEIDVNSERNEARKWWKPWLSIGPWDTLRKARAQIAAERKEAARARGEILRCLDERQAEEQKLKKEHDELEQSCKKEAASVEERCKEQQNSELKVCKAEKETIENQFNAFKSRVSEPWIGDGDKYNPPDPRLREDGSCKGFFNIVTQIPVYPEVLPPVHPNLMGEEHNIMSNYVNYATQKDWHHKERRQMEYIDALRRNLNHRTVKKVHILLQNETDLDFILSQGIHDPCQKLTPLYLGKWMHYKDSIEFINTKLEGEVVILLNSDIYLSNGLELITEDRLYQDKKMYALSRWEGPNFHCPDKQYGGCRERAGIGSYDTFIFKAPLPIDGKQLDFQQNIWGAENAFMSALTTAGMHLRNPCLVVQVIHNHCDTGFRPTQGVHNGRHRVPAGAGGTVGYSSSIE